VNLIEAASLKSIPETVDAATVDVALVFLTRPTDLVEITKRKPTSADGWLLSDELRKEIVLPIVGLLLLDQSCRRAVVRRVPSCGDTAGPPMPNAGRPFPARIR
jgi:hypothetical protein